MQIKTRIFIELLIAFHLLGNTFQFSGCITKIFQTKFTFHFFLAITIKKRVITVFPQK